MCAILLTLLATVQFGTCPSGFLTQSTKKNLNKAEKKKSKTKHTSVQQDQ